LVLKPSELTALSAVRVAELGIEAGIPEGVFNVIPGGLGSSVKPAGSVGLTEYAVTVPLAPGVAL
jgi:acyl-CoA reductase-like NAD-dependent aldehyde dehydrogenase